MITPNTEFTFIQVKSDNSGNIYLAKWHDGGVIGVTKRLRTVEKTGRLDDLLLSVIDETMKQVFREAGTKVIYDYIENMCHLKLEEIAEKPEVFSAGLERMLSSGAPVIEKLILKNLYCKLELKFAEKKGYEFSDYIKELRKRCSR